MGKQSFYAVARGRNVGIYSTWPDCKCQTEGFQNARYKKFATREEAQEFINANKSSLGSNSVSSSQDSNSKPSSSGTSRKRIYQPTAAGPYTKVQKFSSDSSWNDVQVIYTDGACSDNGKHSARAGYGVYWGKNHPKNTCGPVDGMATNNRGELQAVLVAIQQSKEAGLKQVIIRTDSQLLINSLDSWIDKWERNGWKTSTGPVKNTELLKEIRQLRRLIDVRFEKVKAHVGIEGNEAADALARKGAEMLCRRFASTNAEIRKDAWELLAKDVKSFQCTEEEKKILARRDLSKAPPVLVSSKEYPFPALYIHWPTQPNRNVKIILQNFSFYNAAVTVVLYAFIQAVACKEKIIRVYSTNETVVKTSNGIYRASKEKKMYDRIQRCVRGSEDDVHVQGTIKLLDKRILEKYQYNLKDVDYVSSHTYSEAEFRDLLVNYFPKV